MCLLFVCFLRLPEDQRESFTLLFQLEILKCFSGLSVADGSAHQRFLESQPIKNDILHRLFETGVCCSRASSSSLAPQWTQVASNFERFLYYSVHGDKNSPLD